MTPTEGFSAAVVPPRNSWESPAPAAPGRESEIIASACASTDDDEADVSPCLISVPDPVPQGRGSEREASRARGELRRRFATISRRAEQGASSAEIAQEFGMPFARAERILALLAFVQDADRASSA